MRTTFDTILAGLGRCFALVAVAGLGLLLLGSATGQAAVVDATAATPGTVSLDQPSYTAHEAQGYLEITIERTGDLSAQEQVGYGVKRQDAQPGIDFTPIPNTYITFQPGQSSYTFEVRIIDQGMDATPVHALAYLYGSYPDSLGANHNSMITILHDDPLQVRNDADPLGISTPVAGDPIAGGSTRVAGAPIAGVSTPVAGNLIAGTKFYVDPTSGAAQAEQTYSKTDPAWAKALSVIADEPGAHRFNMWNMGSTVEGQVAHYLEGTQLTQPGTTVMLSTYNLVHDKCGSTSTPAVEQRYDNFIDQVANGIGNYHVVFFLELDSLITAPCLNHEQLAVRDAELKYAVSVLEADPHTVVYMDGGAADANPPARQARYLEDAGVQQAQGFFLNSTHFDWTSTELHYGQEISKLLGGKHFIINSSVNGRGPVRPKNRRKVGNEVLCNPPGRGLGPLTVSEDVAQQTGYADADGFLWFDNPGGSGGPCVPGAPPTAVYWPAYAVTLADNWVDRVTGPRFDLIRAPK